MLSPAPLFDLHAAPMRIGAVALKVRDLPRVSEFYQSVLGLEVIEATTRHARLGTHGTTLLHLAGDPSLVPLDPRQAGLHHTAFLMPSRADLGRWLAHAQARRVPLQGASDHLVSEALYLADPEGNGIEIYADRPAQHWQTPDGTVRMDTRRLNLPDLLEAAAGAGWAGLPQGASIGHVHLQVGDTQAADEYYQGLLGFDIAARYPGASFYGSGGYHHQLAGNIWHSQQAGRRDARMAGLESVEIILRDAADLEAIAAKAISARHASDSAQDAVAHSEGSIILNDPWGTRFVLRAADATA